MLNAGIEKCRVRNEANAGIEPGSPFGHFVLKCPLGSFLFVIASDAHEERWQLSGFPLPAFDHVSVSVLRQKRCPTWEEMCWVKDQFFEAEELAVQIHPPKSEYVNAHPFVLHLWKPFGVAIPLPPTLTIAPQKSPMSFGKELAHVES